MDTKPLAEGVYFGLSFADYHGDPALGSGNIRALLRSAPDYWYESPMNNWRPSDRNTPGRIRGQAMHYMVLQGNEEFDKHFLCEPVSTDKVPVLTTMDDYKSWLKGRGASWVKGSKADVAAQVHRTVKKLRLKTPPILMDEFKAAAEKQRRLILSFEDYTRIAIASAMITKNPELAEAFKGGEPEVSVFWRRSPDEPMRKCRFDYLKVRGVGDLKAITNTMGVDFAEACVNAFSRYRYDIQAEHYLEGRAALGRLVKAGKVAGTTKVQRKWLDSVAASKEFAMVYVFFQAEGAPITEAFSISPGNPLLADAGRDIDLAVSRYTSSLATFGTGMWVRVAPVRELHRDELPGWHGRRKLDGVQQ